MTASDDLLTAEEQDRISRRPAWERNLVYRLAGQVAAAKRERNRAKAEAEAIRAQFSDRLPPTTIRVTSTGSSDVPDRYLPEGSLITFGGDRFEVSYGDQRGWSPGLPAAPALLVQAYHPLMVVPVDNERLIIQEVQDATG